MSFFIHWIPTLAAGAILAVAGFILSVSIRRERKHPPRTGSDARDP